MTQATKGELWKQLKEAGVEFPRHYREYSTAQLEEAVAKLSGAAPEEPAFDAAGFANAYDTLVQEENHKAPAPSVPVRSTPDDQAGLRMNTHGRLEPLRIDPETGLTWYRDEVRKAAYPKPRGRRVLKYEDPGVKQVEHRNGDYVESFEMPGDQRRPSEVKITLPSYQVGIYSDPKFPFKIHVYNEARGFDLFDVEEYYGSADLVPAGIKRIYVSNVLCYDMRTVIQAIETEYRDLILTKRI